jgi:hypothetical protein
MNPTSKPITIHLDGKPHQLLFDLNTFAAFEEVSGKFFLDFLASVQESVSKSRTEGVLNPMELLRNISVRDVRAFIWAALHTYDREDNAKWPFTIQQLGRMIDLNSIPTLLPALLGGAADNFPEPTTQKEETDRPTNEVGLTVVNGGYASGLTDADALALLTPISEN